MKKIGRKNMKKGVASFYVIAFSTLILLIVVTSFTALVIAQITRSSNDDLAQSAFDSALAGVEDAKLAYFSYQNCVALGQSATTAPVEGASGPISCGEIVHMVEKESDNCDIVARILGRTVVTDENGNKLGVSVDETKNSATSGSKNNMQQVYSCVKMQTSLKDYRTTLSNANPIKAFNVKIDNMNDSSITMDSIKKMKVSWGADLNGSDVSLANYVGGEVKYPKIGGSSRPANPPTIAVGIVQSEAEFDMNDLMNVKEGRTDSAMVYLTPVTTSPQKTNGKTDNYTGTEFKNGSSQISKSSMVKSNDRVHKNLPFGVACPYAGESEFACSVEIELPEPVDSNGNGVGVRGDDNFTVALLLPYGVTTDVMVEFFCEDGKVCGVEKSICEEGETDCITGGVTGEDGVTRKNTNQINLKGIQVGIDSTGRANDLFRRVDTRLESNGTSALSFMGPLELFGYKDTGDSEVMSLEKDHTVICEYNFNPKTCN